VKATSLLLSLACLASCRVSRLGDQQVVRNAFAAQAANARQPQSQPPGELDAADAHAMMNRHREPLMPSQQQGAPAAQVLTSPQLGAIGGTGSTP
jgi:hypothetical protein